MKTSPNDRSEIAKTIADHSVGTLNQSLKGAIKVFWDGGGIRVTFSAGLTVVVPYSVIDWAKGYQGSLPAFLESDQGQRSILIVRGSMVGSHRNPLEPTSVSKLPIKRWKRRSKNKKSAKAD